MNRRGFIVGSVAAAVAATLPLPALFSESVLYRGELGELRGFSISQLQHITAHTRSIGRAKPIIVDGDPCYVVMVHSSAYEDLKRMPTAEEVAAWGEWGEDYEEAT